LARHVITNYDLLFQPSVRTDFHYVVTRAPVENEDGILLQVDLQNQEAAALNDHVPEQTLFVSDIRSGNVKDRWLLSGGTLITDCADPRRIALGIRDANAADPFTYTNIGAGRCDQKLFDHCMQEFETEFILGIRNENAWQQVMWSAKTPSWESLANPDIQVKLQKILSSDVLKENCQDKKVHPHIALYNSHALFRKVTILWDDYEETIHGYVWLDAAHQTMEFRLAVQLDLSCCQDSVIFFGEVTGYAIWKTEAQIKTLARVEEEWGTLLLTPFMKQFAVLAE
jgi:hypothetical protein